MKFPEGGFYTRGFGGGIGGVRADHSIPETAGELEVRKSCADRKLFNLLAQLELLGDGLITAHVGGLQVIQQAAALTDHQQQATAGAVILLGSLQMLGQMVDAVRKQRDLHVGRTGVLGMRLE